VAAAIKAIVKPELLVWARESANLEPIAAARKIKVPDDRVGQWESGEVSPSVTELRRAAAVYRRVLAVFFLPEPPRDFETLRDFRRMPLGHSRPWSVSLHAEYRRAHAQREVLIELAEADEVEIDPRWHLGAVPDDDNSLADIARRRLVNASPLELPRASSTEYEHLHFWITALEEAGVLVMSSEGGRVTTSEMRAFSLHFEELPVIVLNGADAARGRLFSLLHEYAHLLVRTAGICDTSTDSMFLSEDRRLEARCNAIAASILMPQALVLESSIVTSHVIGQDWTIPELIEGARPYGVSVESFFLRLVSLGRLTQAQYHAFRQTNDREHGHGAKSSGGNFYYTKARDLGKGYVRTVTDAYRRSLIDSHSAATYLDVKVGQIGRLADAAGR
jgi:Zn-dependent peptidase ImmA (M78 family)